MTLKLDRNTIRPSPPSSLYSVSSNESLRSASDTHNEYSPLDPKGNAAVCQTATKLPFVESYNIVNYAAKELESISFTILQENDPAILERKQKEYPEQVELSWTSMQLYSHYPVLEEPNPKPSPEWLPDILREPLRDWVPDIRHLNVHRNDITALAACKTFNEAAKFASTMGFEELGHKLRSFATEMDWCRSQMVKSNTLLHKDLPEDLKAEISQRLTAVLKAAQAGITWEAKDDWRISCEVLEYTFEQKCEENPWCNPRVWGQDRDRKYIDTPRSSPTFPSSSRGPSKAESASTWRPTSERAAVQEKLSPQDKGKAYLPPAKRKGWQKETEKKEPQYQGRNDKNHPPSPHKHRPCPPSDLHREPLKMTSLNHITPSRRPPIGDKNGDRPSLPSSKPLLFLEHPYVSLPYTQDLAKEVSRRQNEFFR